MANVRKPNEAHKANGTYRKDRHGSDDEVMVVSESVGLPPDHLDEIATKEWYRITEHLDGASVLKASDQMSLTLYCALFSEHQRLRDQFPTSRIVQLRGVLNDLGLTPASRSKIRVPTAPKKGSKFDNI